MKETIRFKDFLDKGINLVIEMDVSPKEERAHDHPGYPRHVEYTSILFEVDKSKAFLRKLLDELNSLSHDTKHMLVESIDPSIHESVDDRLDDLEEYYREERVVEREERRKEMLHG